MGWRFWRPKHTVDSVARDLVAGLIDGSLALDEPLEDDDNRTEAAVVLELDVPAGASDAEILDLVRRCTQTADAEHRNYGGHGLRLNEVKITSPPPAVRMALRPNDDDDTREATEAALATLMREQPHIHIITRA